MQHLEKAFNEQKEILGSDVPPRAASLRIAVLADFLMLDATTSDPQGSPVRMETALLDWLHQSDIMTVKQQALILVQCFAKLAAELQMETWILVQFAGMKAKMTPQQAAEFESRMAELFGTKMAEHYHQAVERIEREQRGTADFSGKDDETPLNP